MQRKLSKKWNIAYWITYIICTILFVVCLYDLEEQFGGKAWTYGIIATISMTIISVICSSRIYYESPTENIEDKEVKE
jgi:hypothetical protein